MGGFAHKLNADREDFVREMLELQREIKDAKGVIIKLTDKEEARLTWIKEELAMTAGGGTSRCNHGPANKRELINFL